MSAVPFYRVAGWRLWQRRPAVLTWYLGVELVAVGVITLGFVLFTPTALDAVRFGVLLGLGLLQAEAGRRTERVRRRINTVHHVNLTSVWSFAGILLLPPGLAYLIPLVLYAHLGLRSWVGERAPHRQCFSAAAVVVTAPLTQLVFAAISPVPFAGLGGESALVLTATAVAAVAYSMIDMCLIAVSAALDGRAQEFRAYVFDHASNELDVATNCLGAFVALAIIYQPVFVVLALPPVLVIHRSVLVKELEDKATRDQKTGLLNAQAWRQRTADELARAERTGHRFGVLMVDLDHFKRINDTYGHPAGDDVLIGIAAILRDETRQYDTAGRYGGEEFTVLLPDSDVEQVEAVAERIRARVGELVVHSSGEHGPVRMANLTTSVGVACHPDDGTDTETLVKAADAALYAAKRAGRDRVVAFRSRSGTGPLS